MEFIEEKLDKLEKIAIELDNIAAKQMKPRFEQVAAKLKKFKHLYDPGSPSSPKKIRASHAHEIELL